ncbi:MAG: hypothetical protein CL678_11420 [Bdellovibrionaceae bacterium]|nr:hypothetical protein [Pseudobdellovibrionaceae bacterium]|tara:strand:+ start:4260 stop:4889 length:630 start_codon:yes stop_codon:yes gene_type:complete
MSDESPILEPVEGIDASDIQSQALLSDNDPLEMVQYQVLKTFLGILKRKLSFNDFTRECLLAMSHAIPVDAASLLERDVQRNCLFFRAATGYSSHQIINFMIPEHQGIAGQVISTNAPVIESHVQKNPFHLKTIGDAVDFQVKNMAAFPVRVRGHVYGVLELMNRHGQDEFSQTDLELLESIVRWLGLMIEVKMMKTWSEKRIHQKKAA